MDKGSQPVNVSQLNQSRLGLVSQASMLLVTVAFILSDILGEFWKNKFVLNLYFWSNRIRAHQILIYLLCTEIEFPWKVETIMT